MIDTILSAVPSHLLQSTGVVALAWVLTLLLKNNRAQARYGLWCIASLKFLFPFALLTSIGSHLGLSFSHSYVPRYSWLLDYATQPAATVTVATAETAKYPVSIWITAALLMLWVVGALAVLLSWWRLWRSVHNTLRLAVEVREGEAFEALAELQDGVGVKKPVRLAYSYSSLEPGVVGVFRPTLLLPMGVAEQLSELHMEALLLHELLHVRRRDNLLALIHMVVQTLFWFHPLVWWIGKKMVEERERACDEEVLRLGKDAHIYAESILEVCRYCLSSPMPCVSGIAGGDLRRRIEGIISYRVGARLDSGRRIVLALAACVAVALPIGVGALDAQAIDTQADTPVDVSASRPTFDILSIKPSSPKSRLSVQFLPGGRLVITNATLRFLMKIAYDVNDDQIDSEPGWVDSKRFDIEGKMDVPAGGDPRDMPHDQRMQSQLQERLRLQSLLADRFQLRFRTELKDMELYALVAGKHGVKLQTASSGSEPGGVTGGRGHFTGTNASIDQLVGALGEFGGHPVINKTGLQGKYDFTLEWTPDAGQNTGLPDAAGGSSAVDTGTALTTAVQEQLGLKLEPQKSAANVLRVERAAMPSEN